MIPGGSVETALEGGRSVFVRHASEARLPRVDLVFFSGDNVTVAVCELNRVEIREIAAALNEAGDLLDDLYERYRVSVQGGAAESTSNVAEGNANLNM